MEPSNSWEISYVIAINKPHVNLGVPHDEVFRALSRERKAELREWANQCFHHSWFLYHI